MTQFNQGFKKIVSSSGISLLFRAFGLGTSFLTTLLITSLFGLGDFGNYSLIFTICQACSMIFALGIPNGMIKIVGNHQLDMGQAKALLKKALQITLIGALLPVSVFYFGSSFFSISVFNKVELTPYFAVIAVTLPLAIAHELFLYFFVSTQKFMKFNLFMFVLPNVFLVLFLLLAFKLGYTGVYTFWAFFASMALVIVFECLVVFERRPEKKVLQISSRRILNMSSPMMFSSLLLYLLNWTDILMLGPVVDEKQIGIYNVAYKVGTVGFLVTVSVSTVITPKISELFGRGELQELRRLVQHSTRLITLVTVPVILILMCLGEFILSLFSPEAVLGYTTLLLVTSGVLFSAVCGNVDQVLNMTNNQNVLRNITFGCFLLNVALNFALIPRFGINGAAGASLVTNIVLNVICVLYIRKRLGFYTINLSGKT